MVRSALLAASLALMLSGCNTAYNYFEEEEAPTTAGQPTTAFGALLTMGGMGAKPRTNQAEQPRAPLAIPGSMDLPAPEDESAAEVAVNFPEDHDARRDRIAEEQAVAAVELDEELERRGAAALPGETPTDGKAGETQEVDRELRKRTPFERLTRGQMKITIKGQSRVSVLTEDGQAAPRTSLIHPPSGYRTPADTAALPEPGDIENSQWAKTRLYGKEIDPGSVRAQGKQQ